MERMSVILRGIPSEMTRAELLHFVLSRAGSPRQCGFCDRAGSAWVMFPTYAQGAALSASCGRDKDGREIPVTAVHLGPDLDPQNDYWAPVGKKIAIESAREYTVLIRGLARSAQLEAVVAAVLETGFMPDKVGFTLGGMLAYCEYGTKKEAELAAKALTGKQVDGQPIAGMAL